MGILSGIGFGEYHHGGNVQRALDGLGRITQGKTFQVTKQTRGVVADFVRGEVSSGSCDKSGSCAVESTGMKLVVDGETLAERSSPASGTIKVCIPRRVSYEPDTVLKNGKKKRGAVKAKDRELVAASSALMRILGTGIGSRTMSGGNRILSSSSMRKRAGRVAVPGECVEVLVTTDMAQAAADMQMGRARAQSKVKAGEKVTRRMVRSAAKEIAEERAEKRAAEMKAKRQAALAKVRAAKAAEKAAKEQAAAAKAAGAPAAAAAATAKAKKASKVAKQAATVAKKAGTEEKKAKTAAKKAAAAPVAPAAPKKATKKGSKKAAKK